MVDHITIFGRNLSRIREQKGMSQTELAALVGFKGRSSISRIEVGARDTTTEMVCKLADALGVDVRTLLEGCLDSYEVYEEYLPYLAKAEDWKIKAIRDLLGMPEMK